MRALAAEAVADRAQNLQYLETDMEVVAAAAIDRVQNLQ